MSETLLDPVFSGLDKSFEGDLFTDKPTRLMYSTDASAYRELPLAVARPRNAEDIRKLIRFANQQKLSLIPRTAGTSLAGQVVGGGIVVDVSKYMTRILEINMEESWVRVEPGVVLDELNKILETGGLFFGPETSTSNRCMVGGMVGNNSCGAHSLVYGSTRDHTLELTAILSDGTDAVFGPLTREEFAEKCKGDTLENRIYRNIRDILSDPGNQAGIRAEFPDPALHRRNTGYAIDLLLETEPFTATKEPFNFCRLLAGSEGTLAFTTGIKLNLVPLPPPEKALVCVHCASLEDAFRGNLVALQHRPESIELMDRIILDCTKENIEQRKNRFFVHGDPAAILIVELADESREALEKRSESLVAAMKEAGHGYEFPVVTGPAMNQVWALRKAGLGVLSNVPGDAKPVTVIEDTAVLAGVLPEYMADFHALLDKYHLSCVHYAHIATGELHLKPVLDLKKPGDVELFRTIALETAKLVKKYRGSFSGEHGDGRLRGEFIPMLIGEKNYQLLKEIKRTWDPGNIFNPGKITEAPRMDSSLRYAPGQETRELKTYFRFDAARGLLRAVEQCNGSGDCRKSELIGGTMCPSYMATRDENKTTRARANILREFLTHSPKENPFDHREIYDVLALCLSCKGCKSECPSNVDMAKYKAEFLQHYYDAHGVPLRTRMIGNFTRISRLGAMLPRVYNFFMKNPAISSSVKKILGFAAERHLPLLDQTPLRKWMKRFEKVRPSGKPGSKQDKVVWLFADEFTSYSDTGPGLAAIGLLEALGYYVKIPTHLESGRTFISKGLLKKAKKIANRNVRLLQGLVTADTPLVGLEPSCILTFRDEYPDLVDEELVKEAVLLASNALMLDEFLTREFEKGRFSRALFTSEKKKIRLHGHCQQKSVASTLPTRKMLEIPENYSVEEMKTGCCGMAGSFGYEKEHYQLSMKVGELKLFPEVRSTPADVILAAPGTSCRQQILDGTGRKAWHPVEILYAALLQSAGK